MNAMEQRESDQARYRRILQFGTENQNPSISEINSHFYALSASTFNNQDRIELEEARDGLVAFCYQEEYRNNNPNDTEYNQNVHTTPENVGDQETDRARLCRQLGVAPNASLSEVTTHVAALNSLYSWDGEMQRQIYDLYNQIYSIDNPLQLLPLSQESRNSQNQDFRNQLPAGPPLSPSFLRNVNQVLIIKPLESEAIETESIRYSPSGENHSSVELEKVEKKDQKFKVTSYERTEIGTWSKETLKLKRRHLKRSRKTKKVRNQDLTAILRYFNNNNNGGNNGGNGSASLTN